MSRSIGLLEKKLGLLAIAARPVPNAPKAATVGSRNRRHFPLALSTLRSLSKLAWL